MAKLKTLSVKEETKLAFEEMRRLYGVPYTELAQTAAEVMERLFKLAKAIERVYESQGKSVKVTPQEAFEVLWNAFFEDYPAKIEEHRKCRERLKERLSLLGVAADDSILPDSPIKFSYNLAKSLYGDPDKTPEEILKNSIYVPDKVWAYAKELSQKRKVPPIRLITEFLEDGALIQSAPCYIFDRTDRERFERIVKGMSKAEREALNRRLASSLKMAVSRFLSIEERKRRKK